MRTPGPWQIHTHDYTVEIQGDDEGNTLVAELPRAECPNAADDARLIAAAPLLLEAARAAHDVLLMEGRTGRAFQLLKEALDAAENP